MTAQEAQQLEQTFSWEKQLNELRTANPTNDAAVYFKKGDRRLVAVGGHGFSIPISYERPAWMMKEWHEPGRSKFILGTGGDSFKNDIEMEVDEAARVYARKYNDYMLLLIGE